MNNSVGKAVKAVGHIVLVIAVVVAFGYIYVVNDNSRYGIEAQHWIIFIGIILAGIVQGYLYVGISEIIHLLQEQLDLAKKTD